jgi:uncharacterized protein YukE
MGGINVTPDIIHATASQLDALADSLEAMLDGTKLPQTVMPSGADEVSISAANIFNHAAASHERAARQGVLELHNAAEYLRKHAQEYTDVDAEHAGRIGSINSLI